jgi:hypothetical protein
MGIGDFAIAVRSNAWPQVYLFQDTLEAFGHLWWTSSLLSCAAYVAIKRLRERAVTMCYYVTWTEIEMNVRWRVVYPSDGGAY